MRLNNIIKNPARGAINDEKDNASLRNSARNHQDVTSSKGVPEVSCIV